tara:strand:+ start:775 stop:1779 length:1005 start_codon:yes stop_codon:yes gene_type:complete
VIIRATSDLHLSAVTAPYVWAALAELQEDARLHGGVTVIAGDLFDQATMAHMPTWNKLLRMFKSWRGEIYLIPGNHDQYGPYNSIIDGMDSITPGLRVATLPMATPVGTMVPYMSDPDEFWTAVKENRRSKMLPFVWCHQGFKGAYLNAMRRDTTGLSCSRFDPAYMVVAGHYHMPQNIGRLVYCGSPYEATFAEENQRKGWLRWANPKASVVPERIPFVNTVAPKHHTIHWHPDTGEPAIPPDVDVERSIVRVKTTAPRSMARAAASQLRAVGLEGARLITAPDEAAGRGVVTESMGVHDAVDAYIAGRYSADPTSPAPETMAEWAEEVDLWG